MRLIAFCLIFNFLSFCFASETFTIITPSGGDFAINTTSDKNFKLSSLKDKTVFLYFGFSKCPQICPVTISRLLKLDQYLNEKKIDDVRFLFISIDNENDTLPNLKKYLENKGKRFIAGTSDDTNLQNIFSLYGGRFSKFKTKSNKTIIDHTDNVYVINKNTEWIDTIKYNLPFEEYLNSYLNSKKKSNVKKNMPIRLTSKRIGLNSTCDLNLNSCEVIIDNKEVIKLSFSPLPIKIEKPFNIEVKMNSTKFFPTEIDFQGINQNMGYIRPKLVQKDDQTFTASETLPICELREMDWKIRLLLKDNDNLPYFAEFYLRTNE